MLRRHFLSALAAGTLSPLLRAQPGGAPSVRHDPLVPVSAKALPPPAGLRVPGRWHWFSLGADSVRLRPQASGLASGPAWLRLTAALDDRLAREIEVTLPGRAQPVGRMDVRFAHAVQMFQLRLPDEAADEARAHGVELRCAGSGPPIHFFAPGASDPAAPLPPEFQPHLMTAPPGADALHEFHRRFASLASVQPFGWMQGCVFEGLRALDEAGAGAAYAAARAAHWRFFVGPDGRLVYEDSRSKIADGRIYSPEGCLPFADLARRKANDPLVDFFLHYARSLLRADGLMQESETLSAESSYTLCYPLAVIAAVRRDPALAGQALRQLELRGERLWQDGALWLRRTDRGRVTFRGWSRGVAWHLLGVASAIEPLRALADTATLERDLRRGAEWVLPLQRADGLWSCFVEEAGTAPDTSGSCGIATVLARGARLGVFSDAAAAAARRALAAVQTYLTPDGLLGGVAQSNRGGEALQRGDYRVLSPMGMGLFAQLLAESGSGGRR